MSVQEKLQSYPVPQLRILIKEHNKKVMNFIKDEIKSIRDKFKEEKLIKVTGIKDKDTIIEKMMQHESHFKNVPMKTKISIEEQNNFLDKEMQPILNKLYKEYKADGDMDELEDGVSELYKLAKSKELKIFQSKKKMVNEIKKDVEDELKKEKEQGKPPRPAKPPLFVFKDGKLVLVSLLEKRKLRPKKPSREAPKKIEGTHEMKDGSLMTGDQHSQSSKPVIVIDTEKPKKKRKLKIVEKPKPEPKKKPKLKIVEKAKPEPKKEETSEDRAYNALLSKIKKDKIYVKLFDAKLVYAQEGFFNEYKRFESMIKKRERTVGQIEEKLAKTLKKI